MWGRLVSNDKAAAVTSDRSSSSPRTVVDTHGEPLYSQQFLQEIAATDIDTALQGIVGGMQLSGKIPVPPKRSVPKRIIAGAVKKLLPSLPARDRKSVV